MGSNLDPERSIPRVLELLSERFRVVRTSSIYETDPIGPPGQPTFRNLSVEVETEEPPARVRAALREIEAEMGRVRTADRYAPRAADLDLLLHGDTVLSEEGWRLPHPQVATEAFVLVPLAELAPDRVHPLTGRTLKEMCEELGTSPEAVRRVAPPPVTGSLRGGQE